MSHAAVGDGSAHHHVVSEADKLALEMKVKVDSSSVRLETLTLELESLAKRLEGLGPAYASTRDLDAAGARRDSLRGPMTGLLDGIEHERPLLDDLRKRLEGRHGMALLSTVISLTKDARLRQGRGGSAPLAGTRAFSPEGAKAVMATVQSSTGAVIRSDLDATLELRETLRRSRQRTEAVQNLLAADESAFQAALDERTKLRRIHLAFFSLCGVALAAAAWMFLRRPN